MSDLIDRQAAVEAIENTEWYHLGNNGVMMRGANSKEHQAWYKEQDIYKALEQLPSAQPEKRTFGALILYWITKCQWWVYVAGASFLLWCWRTK